MFTYHLGTGIKYLGTDLQDLILEVRSWFRRGPWIGPWTKGMLSLEQLPCPHKPLRQLSARPGHCCPLNAVPWRCHWSVPGICSFGSTVPALWASSSLTGCFSLLLLKTEVAVLLLWFWTSSSCPGFWRHGWRVSAWPSDALLPTARKRGFQEAST